MPDYQQREASMHAEQLSSEISLNFNVPLMSVRHFNVYAAINGFGRSLPPPTTAYKLSSELSAESLRIPGAVPFLWEQTPGRPKNPQNYATTSSSLPPPPYPRDSRPKSGTIERTENCFSERVLSHQLFNSDQSLDLGRAKDLEESLCQCGCISLARLFQRRRTRHLKEQSKCFSLSKNTTLLPNRPKSLLLSNPHGGNVDLTLESYLSSMPDDLQTEETSSSETAEKMTSPESITEAFRVSTEDCDEDCWVSQARMDSEEFIINRFLPAAKTVAVEAPQLRRWTVEENLNRVSNHRISRGSPQLRFGPLSLSTQQRFSLDGEEEEIQNASAKACRFFSTVSTKFLLYLNRSLHVARWLRINRKKKSSLPCPGKLNDEPYRNACDSTENEICLSGRLVHGLGGKVYECWPPISAVGLTETLVNNQPVLERGQRSKDRSIYHDPLIRSYLEKPVKPSVCVVPLTNRAGKGFLGSDTDFLGNETQEVGSSNSIEIPYAAVDYARMAVTANCRNNSQCIASGGCKVSLLGQELVKVLLIDHSFLTGMNVSNESSLNNYDRLTQSQKLQPVKLEPVQDADTILGSPIQSNEPAGLHPTSHSDVATNESSMETQTTCSPALNNKFLSSTSKSPTQRNWLQRDYTVSPPLPESPTESWLWMALQSKRPRSSLST